MVYASAVNGQVLNFSVSGMLWNRSLVMQDQETKSLWSHILGRAMRGQLKGTELELIPAKVVTWGAWKNQHPETTVLNMRRTTDDYTKNFYKHPEDFVYGWISSGNAYSVSFQFLLDNPILNINQVNWPLLITFDPESTAVNMFSRRLDDKILQFVVISEKLMKDKETESIWDRNTGISVKGLLKGKALKHKAGIVSFKAAWNEFHPDNVVIIQQNVEIDNQ
ncbi:DUF3179 domain-containing protein [Candidatus Poribacteria bacterium]|nr:DUF3179 domain-containing protein [Candidatus Poribacteria bacterium]